MSRVDGIHFPTGQDLSSGLLDVLDPTSTTILNEPEARWHYADFRRERPDVQTIWRASPDVKPAYRQWDAHAYSRDIFRSLDFHADRHDDQYPTDILLLNELNLDYERGEVHNDGGAWDTNPANWPGLYRKISTFLVDLVVACDERATDRGFHPRWWFPAWAPQHGEQEPDIASIWAPLAEQAFEGICLHSYGDADRLTRDVQWYATQFPNHPLLLGEWNTDNVEGDRIQEERRIRGRLRALGRAYPQLSACYFIWAWEQDAARKSYDIDGNDERRALWDGRMPVPEDDWSPEHAPAPAPDPLPTPDPDPVVQPDPVEPAPVSDLPFGIDIASHQGYPDWRQVKAAGVEFVLIKATEGVGYINPTFASGWDAAREFGIRRGAYHFARPDLTLPEPEADFFWGIVSGQGLAHGDTLHLDMEDYQGSFAKSLTSIRDWTWRFLHRLEQLCGFKPMLYVDRSTIVEQGFYLFPELGEYGLWLAAWTDALPSPPTPWPVIAIWQKGNDAIIPGIQGRVDYDYFNGPIEVLDLYGYQPGEPEPGPAPEPEPEPDVQQDNDIGVLRTKIGYLTHDVADILEQEVGHLRDRADALQAIVDEMRRQWS